MDIFVFGFCYMEAVHTEEQRVGSECLFPGLSSRWVTMAYVICLFPGLSSHLYVICALHVCYMSFQVSTNTQYNCLLLVLCFSSQARSLPRRGFPKPYLCLCKQYFKSTTQDTQHKFHLFPAKMRARVK